MAWKKAGPRRIPGPLPDLPERAPAGAFVLPASLAFQGELSGSADLVVEGRFQGRIALPDNQIHVATGGSVRADIEGRVIVVAGEVEGDLTAREQILVTASGSVRGNAKAPRVAIEDGARLQGKIEMDS